MVKLPRVSGRATIKALEKLGFRQVRQSSSHVVMKKDTPDGAIGCVVPVHDELATGTLRSILRQAQVDPEDFKKLV